MTDSTTEALVRRVKTGLENDAEQATALVKGKDMPGLHKLTILWLNTLAMRCMELVQWLDKLPQYKKKESDRTALGKKLGILEELHGKLVVTMVLTSPSIDTLSPCLMMGITMSQHLIDVGFSMMCTAGSNKQPGGSIGLGISEVVCRLTYLRSLGTALLVAVAKLPAKTFHDTAPTERITLGRVLLDAIANPEDHELAQLSMEAANLAIAKFNTKDNTKDDDDDDDNIREAKRH